ATPPGPTAPGSGLTQPTGPSGPGLGSSGMPGQDGSTILGSQALGTLFLDAMGTTPNQQNAFRQLQSKEFVVNQGAVLVNVRFPAQTNFAKMQQTMGQFGMTVTGVTPSQGLITGYVPMVSLGSLASVSGAVGASPVYAPQLSSGPAVDQGDHVMQTDVLRQTTGVTGS